MSREYWANLILCIILAVLAIIAFSRIGTFLTPKGLFISDPEPSPDAASLVPEVRLLQYSLVEGDSRQVKAEFYIRNQSERDVKNVTVLCEFFDDKGKYLDRQKWLLYHTFPKKSEEKFISVTDRYINVSGPVECMVADLQPVEEPFFKLHRSAGGHGEAHAESSGHQGVQGSH